MDDDSATEMDGNHSIPLHHSMPHQHHSDISLNDSKKRTNNHQHPHSSQIHHPHHQVKIKIKR